MRASGERRIWKALSMVVTTALVLALGTSLPALAATSRPTSPNHPTTKITKSPSVQAQADKKGGVTVRWLHAATNAKAFTVLRSADGTTVNLTPKPTHSHHFEDTTAQPGVAYTYTVKV